MLGNCSIPLQKARENENTRELQGRRSRSKSSAVEVHFLKTLNSFKTTLVNEHTLFITEATKVGESGNRLL